MNENSEFFVPNKYVSSVKRDIIGLIRAYNNNLSDDEKDNEIRLENIDVKGQKNKIVAYCTVQTAKNGPQKVSQVYFLNRNNEIECADTEDEFFTKLDRFQKSVQSSTKQTKEPILAAEGDEEDAAFDNDSTLDGFPEENLDDDSINDDLDDMSEQLDDIQDSIDEITEDDTNIDVDNNIENHYIVECESCHGIFISALKESEQKVDHISGTCPLCEKDTDQYVKWVIRKAFEDKI